MSFYQGRKTLPQRFRLVLLSVMQATGLPFSDVLTEKEIEDAFDDQESWLAQEDDDVFTPLRWQPLDDTAQNGAADLCTTTAAACTLLC